MDLSEMCRKIDEVRAKGPVLDSLTPELLEKLTVQMLGKQIPIYKNGKIVWHYLYDGKYYVFQDSSAVDC